MQIDFHHAVTYVAARNAGFTHEEADLIAYAAQYVDDAVVEGNVYFENAMYQRIASAHKTFDAANMVNPKNRLVWLPFHFLPGNGGLAAGEDPPGQPIDKLVCKPDSPVARDMIAACNAEANDHRGIYRLGITVHVYADTFAHQGFAGVLDDINKITNTKVTGATRLQDVWDDITEHVLPPVGHGRAQTLPDMPFLQWEYTDGRGNSVERDNTRIFLDAADALCKAMTSCKTGTPLDACDGLKPEDKEQARILLATVNDTEGSARHQAWLAAIKEGRFSFGSEIIRYDATGPASWKAEALGTSEDRPTYYFHPGFLTTRWKLFHDVLQQHRITILHYILPKYGICAG